MSSSHPSHVGSHDNPFRAENNVTKDGDLARESSAKNISPPVSSKPFPKASSKPIIYETQKHLIVPLNALASLGGGFLVICYFWFYYMFASYNTPQPGSRSFHEYATIITILLLMLLALGILSLGGTLALLCYWIYNDVSLIFCIILLLIVFSLAGLLAVIGIGIFGYYYYSIWTLLPIFAPGLVLLACYACYLILSLIKCCALRSICHPRNNASTIRSWEPGRKMGGQK